MPNPHLAKSLAEVTLALSPEPLPAGDERYANLESARSSSVLGEMRMHLRNCLLSEDAFAQVAFVGHRGIGKTTELLRLEGELAGQYTPIHLYVDPALEGDFDYTDLLLWLVDSVANEFRRREWPLDKARLESITDWFATRTLGQDDKTKSELLKEAEASGGVDSSWFGVRLKLLSRIKSAITGSTERRVEVRRELQRYVTDLVARVNQFLDHAHDQLRAKGQPPRLLLVQDNLDRLPPDVARRLFFENGSVLRQLRADFIWTAPVGLKLKPHTLKDVFPRHFIMPVPAPRGRDGSFNEPVMHGLLEFIARRMDIGAVFDSETTARRLCEACGGSLRDLIKLLSDAQLAAQVRDLAKMDAEAAERAKRKLRLDFETALIPGETYYPLLAKVHRTKLDPGAAAQTGERDLFAELIANGSVLQYNGDANWFDVHPVIQDIQQFKDATAALSAPAAGC
jgi:hypothetical protein